MKSLNAKLIKDIGSQTITYKGSLLTVSWGGEYYTALHAGKVYRQTVLSDLKKDIINGWNQEDVSTADDIAEMTAKQERNLATAEFAIQGRLVDDKPAFHVVPSNSSTYANIHGNQCSMDFTNVTVGYASEGDYLVFCTGYKPSAVVKGRKEVLAALRAYVRAANDMGVEPSTVIHNDFDQEINDIVARRA